MTDQPTSLFSQARVRLGIGAVVLAVAGVAAWLYFTAGRETTDDAQIDAHVTQVAPRVGGVVVRVPVSDNQPVDVGAVLVEIDPHVYQMAVDKAHAELADAEASARAAQTNVPIMATQATSNITTAKGGVEQASGGAAAAEKEVEAARARLTTSQARLREAEANAARTLKDVERLRGLLAKDEISQQMFDTASAASLAQTAAAESARSQVVEAEAGIRVAESKLVQARAVEQRARADVATAQSGPQEVSATKAKADAAEAQVEKAKASLAEAEYNLVSATVKARVKGNVSRKSVEVGQTVQAGQPLLAVVALDSVWVTANFKETQLMDMHPGQTARVTVDTYGGRAFKGHVDSIASATGARFSLLPPENATGNFVKVVQRIPVKIAIEGGQDAEHVLRPGMSVTATVYTK